MRNSGSPRVDGPMMTDNAAGAEAGMAAAWLQQEHPASPVPVRRDCGGPSVASVEGAEPRGAMGGLLEKPSKEKSIEAGGDERMNWVAADMQGWRQVLSPGRYEELQLELLKGDLA
eukprot:g1890.t2